MTTRPKIPPATETDLLAKSGRRCAICVALDGNIDVQSGQIAHVDRERANNAIDNLCFLCLRHHDEYDSRTSQSKGITEKELRAYRERLYAELPSILSREVRKAGDVVVNGDLSAGSGEHGPGGDVRVEAGTGRRGASGGDARVGPGTFRAGDGGVGKGGDLIIKGGTPSSVDSRRFDRGASGRAAQPSVRCDDGSRVQYTIT